MEYRKLGKAGIKVSPLCLGAGVRGDLDETRFIRSIERAIDLGCNFIDCANGYGRGQSETILGRVIKGKRDNLVITSKVFSPVGSGPNDRGLSRVHIMNQVELSLKKLQTDRIDLYYMHHPDPETGLDETLRTMEDLVRQGKVRYVGASNHSGAQVVELLWAAERLGLEPVVCLQNHYNLLHRWKIEEDLLPVCRRFGLALTTYSPLAVGLLSGQFRPGQEPAEEAYWNQAQLQDRVGEDGRQTIQTLLELAQVRGASPAQVAIAWLLDHPEVTAPIVGADRPEYVDDVFGALEIKLTEAERQTLDQVSQWDRPGQYI